LNLDTRVTIWEPLVQGAGWVQRHFYV